MLLANGALALARLPLPDADLVARTSGWIVPVTPGSLHDWEIPALSQRVAVASSELQARDRIFSVSAPLDELAAVHARAAVVGSRMLVVGGLGVVLLIAFVGLAATRLRRDTDEAWRRLTWHGAGRAQLVAASVTEAAVVAAVAVVVGWLAGAAGGALLARRLGADAGAVTRHALLSGRSPGWAVALVVLSALFVVVVLRARVGQRAVFDVAAVGAVGAVVLALARGDAGASSVGGGTNVLLLLLPALVLFAAAVISVRILRPMLVLLGRNARGASPPLRLAALSLSRGAGSAVLAAAFVVVSIAIVVFALAYRATLDQSQRDQAAFAVPADFVLGEDLEQLVTIQDARAPYARLGHSFDVMRAAGEVPGGPSFTLLAAPSREVAHFDGWRGDFSQNAPGEIAHEIAPARPARTRGLVLPLAARALALPVRVRGDGVALALDIRNRRGDFSVVSLGETDRGTRELARAFRRWRAAAASSRSTSRSRRSPPFSRGIARAARISVQNASVGTLELGRVVAAGKRLPAFRGWIGVGGARGGGSRFRYVANRASRSLIRPQQPTDGMAVPVV